MQIEVTGADAAEVVSSVVNVVSNLEADDERSTDNLDRIADIYEDITELVQEGEVNVTESVSQYYLICTSSEQHS